MGGVLHHKIITQNGDCNRPENDITTNHGQTTLSDA